MNVLLQSRLYMLAAICAATSAGWYVHIVTQQVNRELDGVIAYQAHLFVPVGEPHSLAQEL